MITLAAELPQLFASHWTARGLAARIRAVDVEALCDEYRRLRNNAPLRSGTGKRYFVGHNGIPSSSAASNRLEEHTALALMNLGRRWPQTQGGWFRLLDYQLPLKSRQADARIANYGDSAFNSTARRRFRAQGSN